MPKETTENSKDVKAQKERKKRKKKKMKKKDKLRAKEGQSDDMSNDKQEPMTNSSVNSKYDL